MSLDEGTVSARRGRPARSGGDIVAMRKKVAHAAAQLFRDEGYASVSMRRLAKEVGCTPMTLYAYFDSKADILSHLWEGIYDEVFAELSALAGSIDSPADRLAAVAAHYVRYWVGNPERYRLVFMTEGVSQAEVSSFLESSTAVGHYQLFFGLMRDALEQPDDADLKPRSEALLCSLLGIAHSHVTISGYPWCAPEVLTGQIVSALMSPSDRKEP